MNKGKNIIVVIVSVVIVLAILIAAFSKGSMSLLENAGDDKKETNSSNEAEYVDSYSRIFGEFTAKTTSGLLSGEKENTCYSPISLFAALTLIAENTEGETEEEILEGLGVKKIEELEEVYGQMINDITTKGEEYYSWITLANSLWINNEYLTEDSNAVIQHSEEKMSCEIFGCDTIEPAEVNNWVSEKTNGLVEELLSDTKVCDMALISALHYKSKWSTLFHNAGEKVFCLENGDAVETAFITSEISRLHYKECEEYTIANVPLMEGKMVFVLPREDAKLEEMLTDSILNEVMALITNGEMEVADAKIGFPIFEYSDEYNAHFEEMLKDMGIKRLYENSQWKISDEMNGGLLEIMQNTKIIVNSYGIEAAAATAGVVTVGGIEEVEPEVEITIDRPFLYILMKDEVPLFIGTVYNPAG